MDFHEKLLVVLYAAITVFVAVEFFDLWNLSIVLLGIVAAMVVQKISSDRKIRNVDGNRGKLIDVISQRIDIFSVGIDSLRRDFSRSIEFLDNKINVVNNIYQEDMKKGYFEISGRVSMIEQKLDKVGEAVDNAYMSLDSRLSEVEKKAGEGA
ncbi:MAG: hypothetical protein HYT73_03315 [Candidatus Aenigmarchaeota archaeon]|nr:hypothetical protein [Candidatus Aenigmarchaeota archaeon]